MKQKNDWHILDQEAAGISRRLRELSSQSQRAIASKAAIWAAGRLSNLEDAEISVIQALESSGDLSLDEAKVLMNSAEAADEKYFELQAQGAHRWEWEEYFFKARLLRGLAVAFGSPNLPQEDIADAIYEMCHSMDSPRDFLSYIESLITTMRFSSG